jgi:Ni/Co efflux regulator RcnB
MKRFVLAAAAVAALLGAGAASAHPAHGGVPGGHAPAFHPGGFHPGFGAPHGFRPVGFHHWGYGQFMPRDLLVPAAFLVDYAAYDLAAPAVGCEWVQNGPDALLVNIDTGQVIQVVPDAFA